MTRTYVVTIATAAAVWGVPAPGFSQISARDRVLVMPFTVQADPSVPGGAGASFWIGDAAAILISDRLREVGLDALSREERVAAFDRLELPPSSTLTRA